MTTTRQLWTNGGPATAKGMSDLERDLVEGMTEFRDKLKRGDLIPATRVQTCPTCLGDEPEWCSACGGSGVVSQEVYVNDWRPAPPEGET